MILNKPKNTYALAIFLLVENYTQGVTMLDAMSSDRFHKFGTRLGDIDNSISTTTGKQRKHLLKLIRPRITVKTRFGLNTSCTRYKATCSKKYLISLYNYLNKYGLKA
jgi:hypothetical protein